MLDRSVLGVECRLVLVCLGELEAVVSLEVVLLSTTDESASSYLDAVFIFVEELLFVFIALEFFEVNG